MNRSKESTPQERRKLKRRPITYYLCVVDSNTGQMIGHLVDITPQGLKIDSHISIPAGKQYLLHMQLTEDVAPQSTLRLVARCIWCRPDSLEPNVYNVGFQLVNLSATDAAIIQRINEKFGQRDSPTLF